MVAGAWKTMILDMHAQQKMPPMHLLGNQGFGVHGNNQARPCTSHVFSTGRNKGTTAMQKPGNNTKAFGSSRQAVHKSTVES
jgi:hypothetical protein